jgi:hypothetical protein
MAVPPIFPAQVIDVFLNEIALGKDQNISIDGDA